KEKDKVAARYYDNFDFKLKVKKFNIVNGLLMPDLMISPNTTIDGSFDASKDNLKIDVNSEKITYKNYVVKNYKINSFSLDHGIQLAMMADRINISDSSFIGNFKVTTLGYDNKTDFKLEWDNQTNLKNKGNINGKVQFSKNSMDMELDKFGVFLDDSLWTMSGEDHFSVDSAGVMNFHELVFVNGMQSIKLEGIISHNPKDPLEIVLDNFMLNQLNPFLKGANLSLDGLISGTSNLSDIYNNAVFSSALEFNRLFINNRSIGNGEVNSYYDKAKDLISLNGVFKKDMTNLGNSNLNNLQFSGYYYPKKDSNNIDIDVKFHSIDLAIIQPYVKGILTIGRGYLSGDAKVTGSVNKPLLNGKLAFEGVRNLKVDYLNTNYSVNGDIKIEPDRISLEGVSLFDVNGNTATLWGNVFHDNFKNLKLDFDINATKFMCLNTNIALNSAYYGKAFVTGTVGVYGSPENMSMEINVKTEKGTQFNIPLSGPAE
ncbi:MAG TPA: translocation/assembly module TamB domain-containing protein, partial [Nitrosopumilaceae archaeon]|nr:translocation/assembly module TamB domain-containing protein [Nitrosopumilaceae archaeon]